MTVTLIEKRLSQSFYVGLSWVFLEQMGNFCIFWLLFSKSTLLHKIKQELRPTSETPVSCNGAQ